MNLADYLILGVMAQVFYLIRQVSINSIKLKRLEKKCPFMSNHKEEEED
jgi:hypothetical protein